MGKAFSWDIEDLWSISEVPDTPSGSANVLCLRTMKVRMSILLQDIIMIGAMMFVRFLCSVFSPVRV